MNNNFKSFGAIYKKKRWWLVAGLIVSVILAIIYFRGDSGPDYEFMTISRGELVQEVSVTGKVRPAQEVDLQFESSGRVATINYKVGDKINTGAVIASLDNQDLQAAVISAKADLEKTQRDFNSINDPAVYSALRVELENAKINLEQVTKKSDADLAADYSSAFNVMREAMTQLDTSSVILEYLRKTYFETNYFIEPTVKQYQVKVNSGLDRVLAIFPEINQSNIIVPELYVRMDSALLELSDTCQSLRSAFTFLQTQIQANTNLISSSTDRASVNTEATAISSDLSAVSSAIRDIADQGVANQKSIADANAKLATAQATFPTSEDILKKQSALLSAQSQLRKTLIIAPFVGVIGKIDIERGQTISSSLVAISLISSAKYQIEANITEIDIGKVGVGNPAILTLDAYGSGVPLNARVSVIDTSATIVDGVTTYKTIFEFAGPIDSGIRPNMTANIDVQTARKPNVIAIPQRAIISRNGNKIVRVQRSKDSIEEQVVTTGLSGKDGLIEITSGLSEGDVIVTFVND
ncbi:MAG: biotin/lipoyl-binding protein [Candidatus Yanofskybacteria bacterium]|nr:biotin/lipoyl-binding protein [Candidatus Yanofskybacteria bacterium]